MGPPRDILMRTGQFPVLPPSPFAHTDCPPGPGAWAPDHFRGEGARWMHLLTSQWGGLLVQQPSRSG